VSSGTTACATAAAGQSLNHARNYDVDLQQPCACLPANQNMWHVLFRKRVHSTLQSSSALAGFKVMFLFRGICLGLLTHISALCVGAAARRSRIVRGLLRPVLVITLAAAGEAGS
jgi:hypothetical protein